MKSFFVASSLALAFQTVESFAPLSQPRHTTKLSSSPLDLDYIKSAGGGIPMVPSGDYLLFDPNEQGKLSSCKERIASGISFDYLSSTKPITPTVPVPDTLDAAQNFLEDISGAPFAKANAPATATVLGRVPLITEEAPGDIQHILMQLPEGMHYMEGQSLSVIPPGLNEKGKPHKPRLYSIASTRYGELLDGNTVSLCVRRAEYVDPATGLVDPSKAGVCSNYLCDITPGEKVQVAGPVGKSMLLPENYQNTDLIMVATGTGIAPFRAFLRRLFAENTVARHLYNGQAWLVLGVPVTGGLLYHDEFQEMMQNHPQQFQATYAISREMQNKYDGGKLYVQHVLMDNAQTILERLNNGAHIYFCGLKGMMPGILDALEQVATQQYGLNWKEYLSDLKKKGQWHVEVY